MGEEDFLKLKGDIDLGDDPAEPPVVRKDSLDIRLRVDLSMEAVPLVFSFAFKSFVDFELLQPPSALIVGCIALSSIVDIVVQELEMPKG